MAHLPWMYLALVALALAIDHRVFWRRFVDGARTAPARARRTLWRSWIVMLWVLATAALVLWHISGQPWHGLGLLWPAGWRLGVSVALIAAVIGLYAPTLSKLGRVSDERLGALRARFGSHADMLPHTRGELGWFIVLAITAGICEELIFRGSLLRALQPATGLWVAAGLSSLVFALAHAYQGMDGVLKTGLMGLFFVGIVLAFRSLLPAMLIHVLVDVGQGLVAWQVLRERNGAQASASESERVSVA